MCTKTRRSSCGFLYWQATGDVIKQHPNNGVPEKEVVTVSVGDWEQSITERVWLFDSKLYSPWVWQGNSQARAALK